MQEPRLRGPGTDTPYTTPVILRHRLCLTGPASQDGILSVFPAFRRGTACRAPALENSCCGIHRSLGISSRCSKQDGGCSTQSEVCSPLLFSVVADVAQPSRLHLDWIHVLRRNRQQPRPRSRSLPASLRPSGSNSGSCFPQSRLASRKPWWKRRALEPALCRRLQGHADGCCPKYLQPGAICPG